TGFERVVFEFDAAGVSYDIQYVEEAIPPSGDPVAIAGGEILQIAMTPASGVDLTGDTPVQTYEGPDRFSPAGSDVILEIVGVEDFENHLVWAIGLDGTPDVAVATLENPFRLVVDIATD
ncbi:MAG: hypothetical protein HKO70_14395, partial [Acidimicrobiia bacterium]|nr:hypothetical protein [Acidimicrobiia bacterium]